MLVGQLRQEIALMPDDAEVIVWDPKTDTHFQIEGLDTYTDDDSGRSAVILEVEGDEE
jgi:hypothetical protein